MGIDDLFGCCRIPNCFSRIALQWSMIRRTPSSLMDVSKNDLQYCLLVSDEMKVLRVLDGDIRWFGRVLGIDFGETLTCA